jgi:hypothetical protein
VAPAAARFQPDIILVSAGYDAHWRDPLAGALGAERGKVVAVAQALRHILFIDVANQLWQPVYALVFLYASLGSA